MNARIALCIGIFALNSFSQILSVESGAQQFLGDLNSEIKISPYINGTFEIDISKIYGMYLSATYSFLNLKDNNDFEGLHQFLGRAGVETSKELCKFCEFVSLGTGISLAFVRGKSANSNAENYMLSDNESEFGWHSILTVRALQIERFVFGARFYYDRIWTIPKQSSFLNGGIFAGMQF
ncbi:hypothetical protein AGMMS49938_14840 [Fibrobacterales bacterium]|nr:hypothetical protein AGMMS49938_14840 [Fibrobacterales bacterium]